MVGKAPAQRFTVRTDVLTSRSGFFKTVRNREHTHPVEAICLENEDPQVFSMYLNCVQVGMETLNIGAEAPEDDREPDVAAAAAEEPLGPDVFLRPESEIAAHEAAYRAPLCEFLKHLDRSARSLTDLYLLADKLQDLQTANLVMDELLRFNAESDECFSHEVISHVYDSTAHGHPLRRLMRDNCVYDRDSVSYMQVHVEGGHSDFIRDALVEFVRVRDADVLEGGNEFLLRESIERDNDKCHYHLHSEAHPRCMPKEG